MNLSPGGTGTEPWNVSTRLADLGNLVLTCTDNFFCLRDVKLG